MTAKEWEIIQKTITQIPQEQQSFYVHALTRSGKVIIPEHFSRDCIDNLFGYKLPDELFEQFYRSFNDSNEELKKYIQEWMISYVADFKTKNKEELKYLERNLKIQRLDN